MIKLGRRVGGLREDRMRSFARCEPWEVPCSRLPTSGTTSLRWTEVELELAIKESEGSAVSLHCLFYSDEVADGSQQALQRSDHVPFGKGFGISA